MKESKSKTPPDESTLNDEFQMIDHAVKKAKKKRSWTRTTEKIMNDPFVMNA